MGVGSRDSRVHRWHHAMAFSKAFGMIPHLLVAFVAKSSIIAF